MASKNSHMTLGQFAELVAPGLHAIGKTRDIDFVHGQVRSSDGAVLATEAELRDWHANQEAVTRRVNQYFKAHKPKDPLDIT